MKGQYFKMKRFFDPNPHPFDLGIPFFIFDTGPFLDKHFLNKVAGIEKNQDSQLYQHHLTYYLTNIDGSNEEHFFRKVAALLKKGIVNAENKAFDTTSSKTKNLMEERIERLEEFLAMLKTKDKWGVLDTESERNSKLKKELAELNKKNRTLETHTNSKILVKEEHLYTLIDLLIQLKDLHIEKDSMLTSPSITTWARLLCQHFAFNDYTEINFENTKKYFHGDRKGIKAKVKFTIEEKK